jgi:hypothetical protein
VAKFFGGFQGRLRTVWAKLPKPVSTRAELALKLEKELKKKAKANVGGIFKGNQYTGSLAKLPKDQKVNTRAELAKVAQLSERTLDAAKLILKEGDEETKRKVRNGEVALHRAAKEIKGTAFGEGRLVSGHAPSLARSFFSLARSRRRRPRMYPEKLVSFRSAMRRRATFPSSFGMVIVLFRMGAFIPPFIPLNMKNYK